MIEHSSLSSNFIRNETTKISYLFTTKKILFLYKIFFSTTSQISYTPTTVQISIFSFKFSALLVLLLIVYQNRWKSSKYITKKKHRLSYKNIDWIRIRSNFIGLVRFLSTASYTIKACCSIFCIFFQYMEVKRYD